MKKQLAFLFLFLFLFAPSVHARSYSIDDVTIRAWIQPDGDILINETFRYTFDGEYDRIRRSIHTDGHDGIQNFEAYELSNTTAEPGFVSQSELRALPVEKEGNRYHASLATADEQKSIFFAYELENAVKSYDTYSDLTMPFFGTDENHNKTINNVTIDIVFPAAIEPSQYYAFIHDRLGTVEKKGSEVVRFTTPASKLYSLTEVRVLFPSSMMTNQTKDPDPMPIMEAVDEENKLAQSFYENEDKKDMLQTILMVLSTAVFTSMIVMSIMRLRGRRRDGETLLQYDPLYLYMISRTGKTDRYAFLAGLYSLVEKGLVKVKVSKAHGRFYKDPDSPHNTLHFTLTGDLKRLSGCEKKLVAMLFKKRNTFTVHDLAGATKNESARHTTLYNYRNKIQTYKQNEQEWTGCVVHKMKEEGIWSDRLPTLLKGLLLIVVFGFVLYAYIIDSLTISASMVYGIIGLVLLFTIWRKPKKRWPAPVFFIVSIITASMLYNVDTEPWLILFILMSAGLYFLTPRFLLSSKAAEILANIKRFRKLQEIPDGDMEKWAVRSLLLRAKKPTSYTMPDSELASVAPLAFLLMIDEEPVNHMIQTWKWSAPPSSTSSSSDSGGGFFGDSGGDGGGGGGDGGGGGGGGAD
jgi:uncharacterized membrane protein YgcG